MPSLRGLIARGHQRFVYRRRVAAIVEALLPLVAGRRVLDVGCGNGLLAALLAERRGDLEVYGLEVRPRPGTAIPVVRYDGARFPFRDASFDTVLLIDTLHHEPSPDRLLRECARVTKRQVLVKDHLARQRRDDLLLRALDAGGNLPYGVEMTYRYLSPERWHEIVRGAGLQQTFSRDSVPGMYPRPLQRWLGSGIQFVAQLERWEPAAGVR